MGRLKTVLVCAAALLPQACSEATLDSVLLAASAPSVDQPESIGSVTASEPSASGQREPASPSSADAETRPITEQRGSDDFINPARQGAPDGAADNGQITLNFVEADVRDVIRTVLGGTLGLNYAIDPNVAGTITLQTSRPIARDTVLSTLESVLRLNGLALARTGDLYRVIVAETAARGAAPAPDPNRIAAPDTYSVQVVSLNFVAAREMADILEPLVVPGAILRVDSERNLLVLSGTRQEQAAMRGIIDTFDVDWLAGMSFALVSLEFAQARDIVEDLAAVFATEEGRPLDGLVDFYPIERQNTVLVITSRQAYLDKAKAWIRRLDTGSEDEDQLYVYYVQNARAADLANILRQVFLDAADTAAPESALAPGLTPALIGSRAAGVPTAGRSTTGTSTVSARHVGAVAAAADTKAPKAAPQRRRRAEGPPDAARRRPPAARETGIPDVLSARIITDEINNALVIRTNPSAYRMIQAALRKLDIVPLQVLIEATIAEVTLNDQLDFGIQWFFRFGPGRTSNTLLLSNSAGATPLAIFPGFNYLFDVGSNVSAVLDALSSITDVKVISSPQLLVLDNRTALLQVGDEVPIATQSSVSVLDPDAPIVNQIQFRETGVVLQVTPRVNKSGLVTLDIDQEVSDAVLTISSGIDSPTIQQRRIVSSVAVNSGQTIALGGLIRETVSQTRSGLPVLSEIPILGYLFGATSDVTRRTELLVLITPRVVRNQTEARAVTEELRNTLRGASGLIPRRREE